MYQEEKMFQLLLMLGIILSSFNSMRNFSNVFKKKSGESPGAFRKEMQAKLIS